MTGGKAETRPEDRIIVALDVPDLGALNRYLDRLQGRPSFYKVGLELFVAEGAAAVEAVKKRGGRIFLDLKLHDIPQTVAAAAKSAVALGVDFLTVHTSGGAEMLARAVEAVQGKTRILGVTVLTSLSDADLAREGTLTTVTALAVGRAKLAHEAGTDGLVCSPHEIEAVRAAAPGRVIVVPGVRPAGAADGDQKRVATPAETIARGADYLVIGRPFRDAPDPAEAFSAVVRELQAAVGG
jgi:orotidine-5'-phosphate decarboxylase